MTAENTSEESTNERLNQRNLSIQGGVDGSNIVVGDRNVINQGPSYYTTNVFGTFEPRQFSARPLQLLSQDEYRWRQVLVQNVKRYWIEGVLEKSLHNQVLIELGLEERAQAVASPISAAEEFAEDAGRPFPSGTQATDIFDGLGAGRTLLILGEPGAGKTTMLLKLTKTLIARMGDDFSQSIPVVLNLSSWAKKRKPIAEWLVQDLYETFQVSKSLGTAWIKEEQLALCLDGLDEVAVEHRNACVQALNQFLQTYGRTEIVVCSRVRDYEALSERLKVKCAIYVQPLTSQQIDQYLEQARGQLCSLRQVFNRSSEIQAFAASPLILSVMSLAYQGCSFNAFSNVDIAQDFRQQLFDTYVERMFLRRGKTHYYTDQQATYWLVWMAQQMVGTSQTVFFIENMQPNWLKTRTKKKYYQLCSAMLLGLSTGLTVGLTVGLIDELTVGLIYGLSAALSAALTDVTIAGITPVETLKWSWYEATKSLRAGIKGGVIVALTCGLFTGLFLDLKTGLIVGLICGNAYMQIVGFIGGLRGPGMGHKTKANQGVWKSAQNAGMFTIIFGLASGLTGWLFDEWVGRLMGGMMGALLGGLIGGMMGRRVGLPKAFFSATYPLSL